MKTLRTTESTTQAEDYNLFKLAVPHHDELQETITTALRTYARNHKDQEQLLLLEIGCGTGLTTKRLLASDPRVFVIAVDIDPKMRALATKYLADYDSRVRFESDVLSALASPTLGVQTIDIVASAYTLHNLEHGVRKSIVSSTSKRIKTGGLYINADKYAHDEPVQHIASLTQQLQAFDVFTRLGRPDLQKYWTTHYLNDEATKITESQEIQLLEELGFHTVTRKYRKGMESTIMAIKH
jgi:tRNA (cmo5U34)-methyltransferase